MKRVILTGGTGVVGNAVVRELLEHEVEVFTVVRPGYHERGRISRLTGMNVHIVECDIREIYKLPDSLPVRGFDAWYQFAWDGLFFEELTDYTKQVMNIKYLLDAVSIAAEVGCSKFIGAGSVSQYELQATKGQPTIGDKHKVYKTAKLCCEYMGRSVAGDLGIQFIWPIITNIYGAGESSPRLINSMIRNLLAGRHQSLSEGNQLYDFIYITDAAKAFHLIGEYGRQDRIYTVAQGQVRPLKDFMNVIRDIVAPKTKLGFGEKDFNGVYLPAEAYDISSLVEDTGFSASISFEEGIRKTTEWIKKMEKGNSII